ncbi:MAG: ABC transporter ATP-binding protein [Chloroflexi bacterium]|nr:ABC transporter ATP-binding protein [Chloroflexota bacterium]
MSRSPQLDVDLDLQLGSFRLRARYAIGDELLVLFGPSGSGKSLTLQCLAGWLRPQRGRVVLNDRVLFDAGRRVDLPSSDRRIGYLVQSCGLFPHLSVVENIGYGLVGIARSERQRRVAELMDLMQLNGLADRHPAEISGGQQQRVALARALIIRPDLLLLDEPFSALDAGIRRYLRQELVVLRRRLGIPILFVTHDLGEAYALADRVAVYDAGQVLQIGDKGAVFDRPVSRDVALLTGTRNVFTGRVVVADETGLVVDTPRFTVRTRRYPLAVGDPVDVCIRPERVFLVRPDRPSATAASESNLLAGRIVERVEHGALWTLHIQLEARSPGPPYDLEVDIAAHPYQVLGVDRRDDWLLALRRDSLHVMPAGPAAVPSALTGD